MDKRDIHTWDWGDEVTPWGSPARGAQGWRTHCEEINSGFTRNSFPRCDLACLITFGSLLISSIEKDIFLLIQENKTFFCLPERLLRVS